MKPLLRFFLWFSAASFLVLAGCEIETVQEPGSTDSPAGSLVINEVFTLPFDEPTRFNWIEFLNAGRDTVDLQGWTLEYTTYQLQTLVDVAIFPDGRFEVLQLFPTGVTGYGRFRVPIDGLAPPRDPNQPAVQVVLLPNALMTVVDNESRMLDVTRWGPGDSRFQYETQLFYGLPELTDTLLYVPDSVIVFRGGYSSYGFLLNATEELVLRNPAGQVVDVVRYGGYQPPSPDPYPGNQSFAPIPPFESIYRYAGGYKTNNPWGNTANDFDRSRADVRPVPNWYSQPHKR
jgi:hypothetical protein